MIAIGSNVIVSPVRNYSNRSTYIHALYRRGVVTDVKESAGQKLYRVELELDGTGWVESLWVSGDRLSAMSTGATNG